jgi:hypothetical protein
VVAERQFPFTPRRSTELRAGDYSSIPLSDGRWACGRVLDHSPKRSAGSTVMFLGALLDWVGDHPPDAESIAGAVVRDVGFAHVKSIQASAGALLWNRQLDLEGIVCPTDVRTTWGLRVAKVRAEHIFVNGDPPPPWERRNVASPLTDDMLRPITSPTATVQFDRLPTSRTATSSPSFGSRTN